MRIRLLLLFVLAIFAVQAPVNAQPEAAAVEPVAHTPDAEKVLQTTLDQSSVRTVPVSVVFTEYTFATEEMANQYYYGICAFLESEMMAISPEGMAYLDLPQDVSPMCGFARMKGTQAYGAVVADKRVLTIWAFGPGISDDAGVFLKTLMRSTDIAEDAKLPDYRKVDWPWKVESHDVDITDYAKTAYDLRD